MTDRIEFGYEASGPLLKTIRANRDEIGSEILATKVIEGMPAGVEHSETLDLDGESIKIGLARVPATG